MAAYKQINLTTLTSTCARKSLAAGYQALFIDAMFNTRARDENTRIDQLAGFATSSAGETYQLNATERNFLDSDHQFLNSVFEKGGSSCSADTSVNHASSSKSPAESVRHSDDNNRKPGKRNMCSTSKKGKGTQRLRKDTTGAVIQDKVYGGSPSKLPQLVSELMMHSLASTLAKTMTSGLQQKRGGRPRSELGTIQTVDASRKTCTCSECGKGFTLPSNLRAHEKTKHTDFPLPVFLCEFDDCNKPFSRMHDRTRHYQSCHTKVGKPHKCPECPDHEGFSGFDALRRHCRVKHPKESQTSAR